MSIIDLLPSGQKNSVSTLMENWQQSPSHVSNPFWATTSQMAQTVLPTHIRRLQLRGRRGRSLREKASVSHPEMYCPQCKPLNGGRALAEVNAGDYNFSCATMIHRVRDSGKTIRSCINQAGPHHMNAYQTLGIEQGALHVKNKEMVIYLSGIQKQVT